MSNPNFQPKASYRRYETGTWIKNLTLGSHFGEPGPSLRKKHDDRKRDRSDCENDSEQEKR